MQIFEKVLSLSTLEREGRGFCVRAIDRAALRIEGALSDRSSCLSFFRKNNEKEEIFKRAPFWISLSVAITVFIPYLFAALTSLIIC